MGFLKKVFIPKADQFQAHLNSGLNRRMVRILNWNEALGDWPGENDFEGATLFAGTKGKVSCGWGGSHPRLLPLSLNKDVHVPEKYPRITGGMDGHWWQWVDASIAGYGKMDVDS